MERPGCSHSRVDMNWVMSGWRWGEWGSWISVRRRQRQRERQEDGTNGGLPELTSISPKRDRPSRLQHSTQLGPDCVEVEPVRGLPDGDEVERGGGDEGEVLSLTHSIAESGFGQGGLGASDVNHLFPGVDSEDRGEAGGELGGDEAAGTEGCGEGGSGFKGRRASGRGGN